MFHSIAQQLWGGDGLENKVEKQASEQGVRVANAMAETQSDIVNQAKTEGGCGAGWPSHT